MEINYKITFHTYWHCGSGLASGADADLLVIKDKDKIPFVPGKTIKGLVRETVDLLYPDETIRCEIFGEEQNGAIGVRSESFFSDATLSEEEHRYIVDKGLSSYLLQNISSTAITDDGTADANMLRKIQVCVPCSLKGKIILKIQGKDIEETQKKNESAQTMIKDGLSYIKRLGAWRNRGLGRCTITITDDNSKSESKEGGEA